MTTPMTKPHIGLISADPSDENNLKQTLADMSIGAYVHTAKSLVEMNQKLSIQKIQFLVATFPANESVNQIYALVLFFKQKKDYQNLPIAIMTSNQSCEFSNLIQDAKVRNFKKETGFFIMLMSMLPLLQPETDATLTTLTSDWLQQEILSSAKSTLGQQIDFQLQPANDDDRHQSFIAQINQEVRSHLGWFKITLRLLDEKSDALNQILGASEPEELEALAEAVLNKISQDLAAKINQELESRGAVFYTDMELFNLSDKKLLRSQTKYSAWTLRSKNISLLLDLAQLV